MAEKTELKCDGCGVLFFRKASDVRRAVNLKGQRLFYCGYQCSGRHKKLAEKNCVRCDTLFQPNHSHVKYCGSECKVLDAEPSPGMKRCTKCQEVKSKGEFYKANKKKGRQCLDGLGSWCKECMKESARRNRETSYTPRCKVKSRSYSLQRNYGMTPEDYDEMLEAQSGVCAVCQKLETSIETRTGLVRKLAVHHSHKTGKVLALCCFNCNTGMGRFNDDPVLLRRAAALNEEG